MTRLLKPSQNGFTLIEVIVILPITILIISILFTMMFKQYSSINDVTARLGMKVELQTILIAIQDDLQYANGYLAAIDPALSDTYPDDYTALASVNRLIIDNPSSTSNRRDPARQNVFINNIGCAPATIDDNPPASDNLIYFQKAGTLYKRTLVLPSTTAQCNVNFLKKTCPPTVAFSAVCPSSDKVISPKSSQFVITYLTEGGAATTTPGLATAIKVELTLTDKVNAETFTDTQSITVRRVN
jgi:type II secretory pathway pseudopilin PulG